ncbi:MAG: hypothetical protein APF76_15580 [Desulfitibacter sp. BRH_c19]|nr:MAG: hypothetical protein APF76_15580 [Desulfitibacter sp. BRH_c19]
MYNPGVMPTVFLHPDLYIEKYVIHLLISQDIKWRSITNNLAERLLGYEPEALILSPEKQNVIVNLGTKIEFRPRRNIPMICISERDDNIFLKYFLAFGGEAIFLKGDEIILAVGSNSHSVGSPENYRLNGVFDHSIKGILLSIAIGYALDIPLNIVLQEEDYSLIYQ